MRVAAIAAAVLLLASVAAGMHTGLGPFPNPAHPIELEHASVDESGRLLTVGGEYFCSRFASAEVDERETDVLVTVRMRRSDNDCALVLSRGSVTVLLERPLGVRVVRNGRYGHDGGRLRLVDVDLREELPPLNGVPQPYANR